jgi:hypothetical protein
MTTEQAKIEQAKIWVLGIGTTLIVVTGLLLFFFDGAC